MPICTDMVYKVEIQKALRLAINKHIGQYTLRERPKLSRFHPPRKRVWKIAKLQQPRRTGEQEAAIRIQPAAHAFPIRLKVAAARPLPKVTRRRGFHQERRDPMVR